jgi:hypothetical protein
MIALLSGAVLLQCGDDKSTAPADTTAPAVVTDLVCADSINSSMILNWTSPGDDDTAGTVTEYDIRFSTTTITEANWASATQASGEPTPQAAGASETMSVTGLTIGSHYCVALKTADEAENWSELSNVVCATIVPDGVSDLRCSETTISSLTLTWTSPWDDAASGTGTGYDLRYSMSEITDANWESATALTSEPTPQAPGETESMTVPGLSEGSSYYFALKARDANGYWSELSNVASGTVFETLDIDTLVDCGHGSGGDRYYRGFYAPSYPGTMLTQVDCYVSARAAGDYTLAMIVRRDTYDGPLVGLSEATLALSDDDQDNRRISFLFPGPVISEGSTVTFAMELVSGPGEAVFYSTARCGSNCAVTCPIIETEGTDPPLDTHRNDGMGVTIIGIE